MRSAVERAAIHAVAAMLLSAPFAARAERTPKGAAESSDPETAWLERRYHAQPSRVDDAEAAEASAAEAPAATAEVPDEASELEGRPLEHRVAAGETLSGIAARHGVRVEQLVASNPGITPDRIREGQRLVIDAGRVRTGYVVEPGDTLTRIAELHGVSVATLRRYNPDLDPDRIRPGQTVAVYAPRPPKSRSQSIGTPARGQLTHGRRLPPGPGYTIRAADRAFATDETVRGVMAAFARARREHPKAPKIAVHDLSLARGGPMNEHRSHQSGRDVDIAYPRAHCRRGSCEFERIGPKELDAALTWTLLQYWLEHELVESIFIDYRLQPPLYREAKARGATREQLARWFQYPGGRGSRHGVIRHYPKHADHMHVRFHCHPSDPECKSYRPLLLQAARDEQQREPEERCRRERGGPSTGAHRLDATRAAAAVALLVGEAGGGEAVVGEEVLRLARRRRIVAVDRAQAAAVVLAQVALLGLGHHRARRHGRVRIAAVTEPEEMARLVRDHVLQIHGARRTDRVADRQLAEAFVDLHVGVVDLAGVGVVPDQRQAERIGRQVARSPIVHEHDRVGVRHGRVVLGLVALAETDRLAQFEADVPGRAPDRFPGGERHVGHVADALEVRVRKRPLDQRVADARAPPGQPLAVVGAGVARHGHLGGESAVRVCGGRGQHERSRGGEQSKRHRTPKHGQGGGVQCGP